MECSGNVNSEYMAIAELTKEIGTVVEQTLEKGNSDLTPSDIEHILKMSSDVAYKIRLHNKELTV